MKITTFILSAIIAFNALADSSKIATWNANWFPCGSMPQSDSRNTIAENKNIDYAAGYLAEQQPTILVMTGIYDTKALGRLNEWHTGVVSSFSHNGTVPSKQIAILSKSRPLDSGSVLFVNEYGIEPPRGFVWAVYELKQGVVMVIGIDFKSNYISKTSTSPAMDHKLNIAKRETSARQIVAFVNSCASRTFNGRKIDIFVVAGDTKFYPRFSQEENTMRILNSGGFTHYASNHPDMILARGRYANLNQLPNSKNLFCNYSMLCAQLGINEANRTRDLMVGD